MLRNTPNVLPFIHRHNLMNAANNRYVTCGGIVNLLWHIVLSSIMDTSNWTQLLQMICLYRLAHSTKPTEQQPVVSENRILMCQRQSLKYSTQAHSSYRFYISTVPYFYSRLIIIEFLNKWERVRQSECIAYCFYLFSIFVIHSNCVGCPVLHFIFLLMSLNWWVASPHSTTPLYTSYYDMNMEALNYE